MRIIYPTIPPTPAIPRRGFYAGCTRDELVSILYPHGRDSTAPTLPSPSSVPRSTELKRKRLGGLVKSVSKLFQKDKANKLNEPGTLVAKPLSSADDLRSSGVMFDASEELDGVKFKASAGLGNGSESAEALSELIDAHSEPDQAEESSLATTDSFSFAELLAKFPPIPDKPPVLVLLDDFPDVPVAAAKDEPVVSDPVPSTPSTSQPVDTRCPSTDVHTRPSASSSVWFFKQQPERRVTPIMSGESNRKSVFRRMLDVIQTRRVRPLRLAEKVKAEALNQVKPGSANATQVQESSVPTQPPIPDLIVTDHEDETQVVIRIDGWEYEDPAEPIEPELLFPNYVRERYPGNRQFADLPRLTLSTSGWDLNLQVIDEEEEEEERCQSWFSDSDSEQDYSEANDSGSSSRESTPPMTPVSVDMPLNASAFGGAVKSTSAEVEAGGDSRVDAVGIAL
ncbi:hypothetical protein FRC07_004799 [Ceratobasidium sp. 392]|nr:hypothetical protein FRC07_004799 [Ceratobasidium sp. 392]